MTTLVAPPARGTAEDVIVLSGLTKLYEPTPRWMRPFVRSHIRQPVQALAGVDLVVKAGEICAIVGPNGAGKTTLFRIIVGLTTPTSGRGTLLGYDIERESEAVRQVVGWMPAEDRSLLMRTTCSENLFLHGRLQGMSARELEGAIPDVLDTVGLRAQTHAIAATLSAGQKARLRLARALLPRPRVLILDEPTGAIDPIAAHGLLGLITDLARDQKLAILLSSHRLEEIEALQSNAVLLDGGRVRFAGDLDELRDALEEPRIEITMSSEAAARRLADRLSTSGIRTRVEHLAVRCDLPGRAEVGNVLAGMLPEDLREVRRIRELPMPLRDLIAHIYANEKP